MSIASVISHNFHTNCTQTAQRIFKTINLVDGLKTCLSKSMVYTPNLIQI